MAETDEVTEGLGMLIRNLAEYFYADDVLVASTRPERLQRVSGVLTGLFDQDSIRTNMWKTVSMSC